MFANVLRSVAKSDLPIGRSIVTEIVETVLEWAVRGQGGQ